MMNFLRCVVICLLALTSISFTRPALGLSLSEQVMMQDRRKTFVSPNINPSNDEMFIQCDDCKAYIEQLKHVLMHETDYGKRRIAAESACHKFVSMFGHDPKAHCPLLLEYYMEPIELVVHSNKLPDVCHLMGLCPNAELDSCDFNQPADSHSNYYQYGDPNLGLNDSIDDVSLDFSARDEKLEFAGQNLTFVQISDVHFDPKYAEGACTECLQVACCHKLFGEGEDVSGNRAGPFGDYNCDANERALNAILDFVLTMDPAPEFFVYVGDSSVHAILELLSDKLEDNRHVVNALVDKLRGVGPIYPVFGNHETLPQSMYFRPTPLAQIILQSFSEQWPTMFNATDEQIATIREHGYYVAEINPTLWILNFNSLYSYSVNIFALLGRLDPVWRKQKEFVRNTLESARTRGAKVIFTSHMRPRHEGTHEEYADYMESLLAEFGDVIILQLYGHEHDDNFIVQRDPNNRDRAVGVSLGAPSLTPFYDLRVGVNPSVRVFTLERDTWTPLDYTQYYVDLEEANRDGSITMKVHYQFTQEYNLPDLSPASFATLSDRIHTNWADFQKYERNFQVLTSGRDHCSEHDMGCRRDLTCHTRTAKACEFFFCTLGF